MESTTLGELVADGRLVMSDGYRTKQSELGRPGTPILRVSEVHDGFLEPELKDYVADAHRRQFEAKVSRAGDVVVTTKGTVGRVTRISETDPEFVYSPQLCFFRVPSEDRSLDPTFLYYWFRGSQFRDQAAGVKAQTDMADYVNLVDMRAIQVGLPTYEDQRRIAASLGAFDQTIELNRQMNLTLDALAQSLLERDLARAATTGAAEVRLGDCIDVVRGLSYTGEGLGAGLPLHNLNSIREGGGYKRDGIKYYAGEYKERHLVRPGEIVVANTDLAHKNRIIGYPAIVPARFGEVGLFSHHLYRVRIRDGSPLTPSFAYLLLRSEPLRSVVAGYRNGTTVAMLPAEALARPTFPLPSADRIRALDAQVAPLLAKIEANEDENETLAALRDALLPRLISGELRVRPSEAAVAATT